MSKRGKSLIGAILALASGVVYADLPVVRTNAVGFLSGTTPKVAAVLSTQGSVFKLVSAHWDTVLAGTLSETLYSEESGDSVRLADFSSFEGTGLYKIVVPGVGVSDTFRIAPDVFLPLARGVVKAFTYNRASMALASSWAGAWAREAGHPDTAVVVHNSAATAARPTGTKIRSPGGWYDAGDYGKYVVNSGISTWTLLSLVRQGGVVWDTLTLKIPESGDASPDILDEALWNLRWMLSMQDPEDGGVYHKLTTAGFDGFEMPEYDDATRYVVQKSSAATLDLAATAAYAYRVLAERPGLFPGLADSCLEVALKAWQWARANSDSVYRNSRLSNPSISTGEYGDASLSDELRWASLELALATGADSFYLVAYPTGSITGSAGTPSWSGVGSLGLLSLAQAWSSLPAFVDTAGLRAAVLAGANVVRARMNGQAWGVPNNTSSFYWGSNGALANGAMVVLHAYRLTGETAYRDVAIAALDWLMGRNPFSESWVTGFGVRSPMHPHHRPSGADGITAPVPGFLVGGPNGSQEDASNCSTDYPSEFPARSWIDDQCSYASNEVAINWNAPMAYLVGTLQALSLQGWSNEAVGLSEAPRPVASELRIRSLGSGRYALEADRPLGRIRVVDARGRARVLAESAGTTWIGELPFRGVFWLQAGAGERSFVRSVVRP